MYQKRLWRAHEGRTMRSRAKAFVMFLLGAALLAGMIAYVGPAEVVRAITQASPAFLLASLGVYALFFLVRGVRWKMLFTHSAPDVRVRATTSISAVGWLANSILPFKGGEVLRAALLAKREKVGLATSAGTVALERVLDLLGLAILAAAGLLMLPRAIELPAGLARAMAIVWALPLVAIAVLAVMVRHREPFMRLTRRVLRPLRKPGHRLAEFIDTVLAGMAALAGRPRLLLKLAPLTLVIAVLQALVFTFLAMAFMPATGPLTAFAGSAIFLLSFVVSVTPGNVGTYEAAFVAVFVALGATPEVAVPAAVLTHLVTTLTVAILGSAGMLVLGMEPRRVPWRPARVPQGGLP